MFPTLRSVFVFADLSCVKQIVINTARVLSVSAIAAFTGVSASHANTAVDYIDGSLNISNNGNVDYTIPIVVPPGIAGLEPSLAFNYNSATSNGFLGRGWDLQGLSVIHRCASTFVQDGVRRPIAFSNNDNYCIDKKRLIPVAGTKGADGTEYRTEINNFSKVVSYGTAGNGPASFKVWTRTGQVIEYATSADSRIEAQGKSSVSSWLIKKVTDTSGNEINFEYTEIPANSEYAPKTISYGPNGSVQVRFEYAEVTDQEAETLAGSKFKVSKRLNKVETYVGSNRVQSWSFDFEHKDKEPSKLTGIQVCAADGECLKKTTFSWEDYTPVLYTEAPETFFDFNGDGIGDTYQIVNSGPAYHFQHRGTVYKKAAINISLGGIGTQQWLTNIDKIPYEGIYQHPRGPETGIIGYSFPGTIVGDFNGDGKTDIRVGYKNYRSTGSGFSYTGTYNTYFSYSADVNGDGRDDFIQSYGAVKVSSESGNPSSASFLGSGLSGCSYYDINGDGFDDAQCNNGIFVGTKTGWGYFPNRTSLKNKTKPIALMSAITDTTTTQLKYGHITDSSVHVPSGNSPDVRYQIFVVKEVTSDNGIGGTGKVSYRYGGAKTDSAGRGYLGFAWSEQTDDTSGIKSRFDYHQDFPYIGKTSRTRRYLSDGTLVSDATATYADKSSANGKVHFPYLSDSQALSYELNGSLVKTTTTQNSQIDDYGNAGLTETTVSAGSEAFKETITSTYQNNVSAWQLGQLTSNQVVSTHANGTQQTRTTAYEYDPATGLVTKETLEPADAQSVSTLYQYDANGNVTKTTVETAGATPRHTLTTYDENHQFPVTVTNDLGQSSSVTTDPNYGNVLSSTDVNGLVTSFVYNGFGDIRSETYPDGTQKTVTPYWADACPTQVPGALFCVVTETDGNSPFEEYFDKLLRPIRIVNTGFNGRKTYTDNEYNAKRELSKVSRPYYVGDDIIWATTTYDDMGRTLSVSEPGPDGTTKTTSTVYNGLTTISTNSKGHNKTSVTNALGKIVSIQEPEGASVTYTYDPLGNLIKTRDDQGNETTITYDLFGRKTGMNDPDMGIWQYSYNGYGELISQTDAKGQTSTMTYDVLGRMVSRTEAEGTSTWEYDTAANGIGKLAKVTGPNGYEQNLTYDSLGRLMGSTTLADARSLTITNEYDQYSRVKKQIRPQGFITENVYNDLGYLQAVRAPKSWVADYEAGHVFEELAKLIAEGMSQAQALALEAANLRAKAQQYTDQANALYDNHGTAQQLRAAADKLNAEATTLEAKAGKYLAWVSALSAHPTYGPVIRQSLVTHRQAWEASPSHRMWAENYADSVISQTFARFIPIINGSIIIFVPKVDTTDGVPATDKINYIRFYGEELRQQAATKRASAAAKLAKIASRDFDNLSPEDQQAVNEADSLIQQAELALAEALRVDARINELEKAAGSDTDAQNDDAYVYFWRAKERDASGRLINEIYGNGITSEYTYNTSNGLMTSQRTGLLNVQDIRHLTYQYDNLNNITQRADLVNNAQESFTYDGLDRLKTSQVTSQLQGNAYSKTVTYTYDTLGNITHKSDVGDYSYGTGINNGAGPHAVIAAGSNSYQYDANGNMVSGAGRTIQWSSFNKPVQITRDGNTVGFTYAPDRSRYLKTDANGGKTLYLGKMYELTTKGQAVTHKQFIYAGSELVAQQETGLDAQGQSKPVQTRYMHRDNLGSVDTITDGVGNVVERMSFDPFGERRPSNWREATPGISLIPVLTNRGFTGHETLDSVGLIHMNGRVYDATLGRFLSADKLVQAPFLSQSFNRYSYVMNSPLIYTDPTGWAWRTSDGSPLSTSNGNAVADGNDIGKNGSYSVEYRQAQAELTAMGKNNGPQDGPNADNSGNDLGTEFVNGIQRVSLRGLTSEFTSVGFVDVNTGKISYKSYAVNNREMEKKGDAIADVWGINVGIGANWFIKDALSLQLVLDSYGNLTLQKTTEVGAIATYGRAAGVFATAFYGTPDSYKDLEGPGISYSGSAGRYAAAINIPMSIRDQTSAVNSLNVTKDRVSITSANNKAVEFSGVVEAGISLGRGTAEAGVTATHTETLGTTNALGRLGRAIGSAAYDALNDY